MAPTQATQLDEANRLIAAQRAMIAAQSATIAGHVAAIAELTETVTKLQAQVAWLTRQFFGPKSERFAEANQPLLPGLGGDDAASASEAADVASESPAEAAPQASPKRPSGGKRKPIPENLPRKDRIVDLPEDQRAGLKKIGEDVSETLHLDPGKLWVLRTVRYKYARIEESLDGSVPNVVVAPMPDEGLAKCLAGPSLLAHIVVSKFGDHLPLYREARILERSGMKLSRSSMCRWIQGLATMVVPLLALMKVRLLQSHVIQADETTVQQQVPGRGKTARCYFWSYVGDAEHPYTLYDYQGTRAGRAPRAWFCDPKVAGGNPGADPGADPGGDPGASEVPGADPGEPLYQGYLQCDAYSGYGQLFAEKQMWQMTRVGCWAHVRRKFYDIRTQFPGPAHHALGQIKQLYAVERVAREVGMDAEARLALRQAKAKPLVDAFYAWCRDPSRIVLPKSTLGGALSYALNQEVAMRAYLSDGALEIDNNACERSVRGIALGRKNWLFTGSEGGGQAAAAMFSLISSAARSNVEPLAYLTDLFTRLPATPTSQLEQFLPDRWQPRDGR